MRNQSREYLLTQEKQKSHRGVKKAKLFCGDDMVEQEKHKQPITDYSTEHYLNKVPTMPFCLCGSNVGIPRFYAVMYAVFVSLQKIYGENTVTRWSYYLSSFLPSGMFPPNKRRKLQEVLENTWEVVPNYIENGPGPSRYSPTYDREKRKFRENFCEMATFFKLVVF